uniref:Nicastrin n=1 Tax=Oncorhynchus mykiss TaxID=8022 RepID=A0A8C7USQ0_ONCMY
MKSHAMCSNMVRCLGDGNTSLQKLATSIVFFFCLSDVSCNSVEQKIYVELNNTVPCVRLLNATHQIGCQSSISGDTGVIHVLESEADLEWPLSKGPNPPYMVLLESSLFTRSIMMKMKNESNRVAGVAVVVPNTSPPEFSPHTTCPNENTGVYSDNYGPNLAHCNTTVWNPRGNGLSYEEFDFPVFSLKEDNETEFIKQCYLDHNRAVNGSAPQYPLCAMQLFSHMHAVTNTPTCMRRNDINFSINPGTQKATVVSRDTLLLEPCFLGTLLLPVFPVLSARFLDSRAFFWEVSTGAEGSVSGFVTLLAAAQALREVTHEAPPTRNILFAFFQGETFDYIGSSRMVYDMENGKFVIDLDNIHSVLEIGQVAVHSGTNLFLHSDPVSRRNNTVNDEVREELFSSFFSSTAGLSFLLVEPNVSQPLPPSSLQRFLRAQPIPGIVLADHESAFNNRYYESFYDNAANLNLTYPSDLSPEEQLEFVTDTAKSLTDVATVVARALYKQAGGNESLVNNIKADPKIVTQMLYGFLVSSNNSWFQAVMAPELKNILKPSPPEYYVGVAMSSTPTRLVQYLLANLTGAATNLTQSQCQKPDELPNESRQMYSYLWVQGIVPPNSTERDSFCVRASVRLTKAVSPAFELGEYASKDYSTWTESRWKFIKARIFLVASRDLEMLTLGVGVAVLFTSLLVTYFISTKADVLFSSTREPASAAY